MCVCLCVCVCVQACVYEVLCDGISKVIEKSNFAVPWNTI